MTNYTKKKWSLSEDLKNWDFFGEKMPINMGSILNFSINYCYNQNLKKKKKIGAFGSQDPNFK